MRRCWHAHEEWRELPYVAQKRKKEIEKKMARHKNKSVSDSNLLLLKELADEDPSICLDELTLSFGIITGKHDHQITTRNHATKDLGCTLKVLTRAAKECCETDETQFLLKVLNDLLQECPERLTTINEVRKGRSTSRKRRGWLKRNCKAAIVREWFQNVDQHFLISMFDINGFARAASRAILRDQLSDKGAVGTTDADYFSR